MATTACLGVDLREGDTIITFDGPHTIRRINDYPTDRYLGGHARRAHGDRWHATIADTALFHRITWSSR